MPNLDRLPGHPSCSAALRRGPRGPRALVLCVLVASSLGACNTVELEIA